MPEWLFELLVKLAVAAVFAGFAKFVGGVLALAWMTWLVAAIIGLVVAFGGWLIIVAVDSD